MEQKKLQKLQLKFSFMTLTMEEIADFINDLIAENEQLKQEIEKLKQEAKQQNDKE